MLLPISRIAALLMFFVVSTFLLVTCSKKKPKKGKKTVAQAKSMDKKKVGTKNPAKTPATTTKQSVQDKKKQAGDKKKVNGKAVATTPPTKNQQAVPNKAAVAVAQQPPNAQLTTPQQQPPNTQLAQLPQLPPGAPPLLFMLTHQGLTQVQLDPSMMLQTESPADQQQAQKQPTSKDQPPVSAALQTVRVVPVAEALQVSAVNSAVLVSSQMKDPLAKAAKTTNHPQREIEGVHTAAVVVPEALVSNCGPERGEKTAPDDCYDNIPEEVEKPKTTEENYDNIPTMSMMGGK